MVFYISTPTYQQVIHKTIQENGFILEGNEITRDIFLRKFVKENLSRLDSLELLIIDLAALSDTDDEIEEALETVKLIADNTRIIILACNRLEGDGLLTKLFRLGIYDIINSDDFNIIRDELQYCMLQGKKIKDAIRFKDAKQSAEEIVVRTEIKQVVNKLMLAFAGAQEHIGTTHSCIVLANYLRKRGYMVAVVEYNATGCFEQIRESFDETMFEGYFSMNGVDFYPRVTTEKLSGILGKTYNFILVDFGIFSNCDQINFNKANERFIVLGSKPWELNNANKIFILAEEAAKYYHYLFNFTPKENYQDIREGMEGIESVHFLGYTENPFANSAFPEAETILRNYLPIKTEEVKKKGLFVRKKQHEKKVT